MRGIPGARCGLDAGHNQRWRYIGLLHVELDHEKDATRKKGVTDFIAGADDDVGSAEETGDSGRMCMK